MHGNGAGRTGNGKTRLKPKVPQWVNWAVGFLTAGLALAPWLTGSLYTGPRPVASEEWFGALIWGADMPLLGGALVGLCWLMGLLIAGWYAEMWRLPVGRVLGAFAGFLSLLGISALVMGAGWSGLYRTLGWLIALVGLLGIVAIVRRGTTAWWMLSALVISASLVGLRACSEYLVNALGGVPNWRVFATFFNPNLLAGYLVMTAPVTMGVLLMVGREIGEPRRRWLSALLTVGLWLQLSALVLTASRLGMLSFVGAGVVFLALGFRWGLIRRDFLFRLGVVAGLTALIVVFSAPTAQRLTPQAATQEVHSGAFRLETWKGTARMAVANPLLGVGTGTFEWNYSRYASVGYTRSAHNTYLEVAGESGFLTLILLVGGLVAWFTRAGQSEIPPQPAKTPVPAKDWRGVRVGILAGVVGALLHNAVDSDLQVWANLMTLVGLLGLGLALAVDGVYTVPLRTIERRGTALIVTATLGLMLVSLGVGELYANQARYKALIQQVPQAAELYGVARSFDTANADYLMESGELYYALGRRETALEMLERAVRMKPSARNWYRLGLYYERDGNPERARQAFQEALLRDPHSLPALLKLAQYTAGGSKRLNEEALRYYQRVVEIEESPYGQILAVPQIVETAYGFAHLALAEHYRAMGDTPRARRHYERALVVFQRYRALTYPFNSAGRSLGLYNPDRERQILSAHLATLQGFAELLESRGDTQNARPLREEYNRLVNAET
ncbi:MAG: O-antigen ligase family protein [Fimbriimonadales bacterium]